MAFSKRGLRIVEGLVKFAKDKPQYYDTANVYNKVKFTAANEEVIRATFTVDTSMCNGYDIMHGGYISLLSDVMCLYGHVARTGGRLAYTSNISTNFLKTAFLGDKVTVEAKVIKEGSAPVMESRLYDENGGLISISTANFVNGSEKFQVNAPKTFGFHILQED